jgi:hypothetical protein
LSKLRVDGRSKAGTNRFGKPFTLGQCKVSASKATFLALGVVSVGDEGAVAFPHTANYQRVMTPVLRTLKREGITVFLVGKIDRSLRCRSTSGLRLTQPMVTASQERGTTQRTVDIEQSTVTGGPPRLISRVYVPACLRRRWSRLISSIWAWLPGCDCWEGAAAGGG